MRTRVKICGITRLEDADAAVAHGADALGFVFWPMSPRLTSPDLAAAVAARHPGTSRVGVFVNAEPDEVAAVAGAARLTGAQLHGDEDVERYVRAGVPLIKAVQLKDDQALVRAISLPDGVTVLVDAVDPDKRGGTGTVANWALASEIAAKRPVMLAGGLTAANVGEAIRRVRPWAVDVSSGVELSPGVKSPDRLAEFFAAVRSADQEEM